MGDKYSNSKSSVHRIGYIEVVPKSYGGNSKASQSAFTTQISAPAQLNYKHNTKISASTQLNYKQNSKISVQNQLNYKGNAKISVQNQLNYKRNAKISIPTQLNYKCNTKISVPTQLNNFQHTTKISVPTQLNKYQYTTKNSVVNKQTGSYMKTSMKGSSSTGDVLKERSTGRLGYKKEYKTSKSFRAGDKSGYSEYQVEKRYRRVDYDYSGSSGNKGKGSYY